MKILFIGYVARTVQKPLFGPILVTKIKYTGLRARTKDLNAFKSFGNIREKFLSLKNTKYVRNVRSLGERPLRWKAKKDLRNLYSWLRCLRRSKKINTSQAMKENLLLPEKA